MADLKQTNEGWDVVRPPDTHEDGSLDYSGEGMIVRAPDGKLYGVVVPDICERPVWARGNP